MTDNICDVFGRCVNFAKGGHLRGISGRRHIAKLLLVIVTVLVIVLVLVLVLVLVILLSSGGSAAATAA